MPCTNKIAGFISNVFSPCSSLAMMSKRTSLSSIVPSLAEEIITVDDVNYIRSVFPHLIAIDVDQMSERCGPPGGTVV